MIFGKQVLWQTMKTTDTYFCEKSVIDRSFFVLEISKGALCTPLPFPRSAQ